MIGVRSSTAILLAVLQSCEPAYACPVVDQGVAVVDIGQGCPAPFDGVLHTHPDEDIRTAAADRASASLDASAKKIRDLEAAAKAVPTPPSRLEWFLYGAASAILVAGSITYAKGAK